MSDRHFIQRQIIELRIGDRNRAREIESTVRDTWRSQVLPRLERCLDELAPSPTLLRLERLESDLGDLHPEDIRGGLPERVVRALTEALTHLLNESPKTSQPDDTLATGELRPCPKSPWRKLPACDDAPPGKLEAYPTFPSPHVGRGAASESLACDDDAVLMNKAEIAHPGDSKLVALQTFLHEGRWPWWSDAPNAEEILLELAAESASESSLVEMLRRGLTRQAFRRRLVYQISSPTIRRVLQWLTESHADIVYVHDELCRNFTAGVAKPAELAGREECLLYSVVNDLPAETFTTTLSPENARSSQQLRERASGETPEWQRGEDSRTIGDKAERRHQIGREAESVESLVPKPPAGNTANSPIGRPTSDLRNPSDHDATRDCGDHSPLANAEIYTEYAGLVILWPYLARLFAAIDFTDDNQFRDPAATHRAMHLLHCLATGEEGVSEHELTLHKVLCGVPLETPIPFAVDLTTDEKGEGEQLLNAVRSHWSPLKNTSLAGLRQSFLQRAGKLTREPDQPYWRLQVETKTYDMLLEQLPWSIYVVKLPWMPEPMHVEW